MCVIYASQIVEKLHAALRTNMSMCSMERELEQSEIEMRVCLAAIGVAEIITKCGSSGRLCSLFGLIITLVAIK